MLDFLFKVTPNLDPIPDGIFPKRQVVGTSVVTTTAATTITSSVVISATTMSTSSPAVESTTSASPSSSPSPSSSSIPVTSTSTPITTTTPVVSPTSRTSQTSNSPTTSATPPTSSTQSTPSSTSSVRSTATSNTSPTNLASTVSGSDLVVVGSSTINRSSLSSPTTITSALIGSQTEAVVTTSFWTSNGQVYSTVFTSNRIVSSTTGYATATIDPVLASGDSNSGGGSLSPHSQAIIGGVVGGVGGAILLGGLAFVAWRLWGKKQREKLPADDYYDGKYGNLANDETTDGLERYRTNGGTTNPAMSVNPSSNF